MQSDYDQLLYPESPVTKQHNMYQTSQSFKYQSYNEVLMVPNKMPYILKSPDNGKQT